jgi:hypothetical protein
MNLEIISQKQLNALEHCTRELLIAMRKSKLQNIPLFETLKSLEHELGEARREQFDATNSEYGAF